MRPSTGFLILLFVLSAAGAAAQPAAGPTAPATPGATHWGITFGGAPRWQFPRGVSKEINYDVSGIEVLAGVIRGRDDGGDWGVVFVYRKLKDGSTLGYTPRPPCVAVGPTATACVDGARWYTQGASARGFEMFRFFPLFKRSRVQVGLNLGGGMSWFGGGAVGSADHLQIAAGSATPSAQTSTDTLSAPYAQVAKRAIPLLEGQPWTPTARAEIAAAIRLSPSAKLRIGSGGDAPWGFHYAHAQLQVRFGSK